MPKERFSTVYNEYLASPEWHNRRQIALTNAQHRCQACNARFSLDVHHRTYIRFQNEEPEDLIVLCRKCHKVFHDSKRLIKPPKLLLNRIPENPLTDFQQQKAAKEFLRIIGRTARYELSRQKRGRNASRKTKAKVAVKLYGQEDWPSDVSGGWKDIMKYLRACNLDKSEISSMRGIWGSKCIGAADPGRRLRHKISQQEGSVRVLKARLYS
jgi:hypothetical protein